MPKTSVHIKPCNIAASEAHNRREKDLDYVRKDLSYLNESFSYIPHSLQSEVSAIRREVREKTGRKLQKNAIPLKEAVVVIDEHTTMSQLRAFSDECQRRFGMVPLQIYIHRDEGHAASRDWKPNLHAHVVFRMYDRNGRNVRLSREGCREIQTIASKCLGMERGQSSDRKHLDVLAYKIAQREQHVETLDADLSAKTETAERLRGAFEGAREGVVDAFVGKSRRRAKDAEKRAAEAEKGKKEAVLREHAIRDKAIQKIAEAEAAVRKADARVTEAESRAASVYREWARRQDDLAEIEEIRNDRARAVDVLTDAAEIGLTSTQTLALVKQRWLDMDAVTLPTGQRITSDNGTPIKLKLEKGRILAHIACVYEHVTKWIREALHSPWFCVDGIPNDRRAGRGMHL